MDKRLIVADKQLEWMDKNYYRYETKNDFLRAYQKQLNVACSILIPSPYQP
ncbi:hypothetical protein HMSSN139_67440 [Paenibacillus sp. HMSSN-139]|nr:hypothetical protein HMSSN139_67440 [Paenibacillus sp. HMSSN-139]